MNTKTLYARLIAARVEEEAATKKRIKIEEGIFTLLKVKQFVHKSEGNETIEDSGYAVTVSQPMTYKLDEEKYRVLAERLPESLQFHRVKLELDKIRYKIIMATNDAGEYVKDIQNCITVKPGKVSIKVEKI